MPASYRCSIVPPRSRPGGGRRRERAGTLRCPAHDGSKVGPRDGASMAERQRRTPDDPSGPVVLRPLVDFLHTEAAGGVVLLAATVVALGVGQLAVQGLLHRALAHPPGDHGRAPHARPRPAGVGQRRADGHLLLRRRPRDQAGARGGRAARAAAGRHAGHRRGRRHAVAGADLHGHQRRRRWGGRVGDPDGHRHRDGRRRPEPPRPAGRLRPSSCSCSPSPSSTTSARSS